MSACTEQIWHNYSSYPCGRKLKGDPRYPTLCGLHVSVRDRAAKKEELRKQITAERADGLHAMEARAKSLSDRHGVTLHVQTVFPAKGPGAFVSKPTGKVIISLDELEALLAKLAE